MGTEKVMNSFTSPFNSPIEVGLRSLVILNEAFPAQIDLERLVIYDYIVLHTEDVGGPPSLHPSLPLRTGELTVRRELVQKGLILMASRGLVIRIPTAEGILFIADDTAGGFLSAIESPYVSKLIDRAGWVIENFRTFTDKQIQSRMREFYNMDTWRFQLHEKLLESQ